MIEALMQNYDLIELLPLLMFPVLLGLIASGFPVAFVLMGTGLIFAGLGFYTDLLNLGSVATISDKLFGVVNNLTLTAVPLFIFMGLVLERAGLAEELLETIEKLMSRVQGSLLYTVVIVGAVLAASTGIVGATVVTMGLLSLPTLLKKGYPKQLACGTIAASGTLGQIIPPSIVLVILGDMMNVDVGDLFTGALIPGLLLVLLYLVYIFIHLKLKPTKQLKPSHSEPLNWVQITGALFPPILLMFVVLGSILGGLASPTEAAACGAFASLAIALAKRKLNFSILKQVGQKTSGITAMVFMLLIGAQVFAVVFRGMGGDAIVEDMFNALEMPRMALLACILFAIFLLGFFLDFLEICFIALPILTPIFAKFGFDSLWVSILIAINLQTSFLTPPFGFSLFYLKGVAPKEVKTTDIYMGIIPFVLIQLIVLLLVFFWQPLVTWLPQVLYR